MYIDISLRRLLLLLQRSFWLNAKKTGLELLGNFAVYLAVLLGFYLIGSSNVGLQFNQVFWVAFFVYGIFKSTKIFMEYHEEQKRAFAFTLPASQLEKFLNAYFTSLIVYPLGYVVTYGLVLLILSITTGERLYLELWSNIWQHKSYFWTYFGIHSSFFLGAVIFRKGAFAKTIAALGIVTAFTVLLIGGWTYLVSELYEVSRLDAEVINYATTQIEKWRIFGLYNIALTDGNQLTTLFEERFVNTIVSLFLVFTAFVGFKELEG